MSRLLAILLLNALLAAPASATQPQSEQVVTERSLPPNAYTTGPVRPDALDLVKLMMPEDLCLKMIEHVTLTGFNAGVEEGGELDERLLDTLRKELPSLAREHERVALPTTYDRYARAVGDHFSPGELKQLATFYRTRTGQKVIVGKFAGIDLDEMLRKWNSDPDAKVTTSDIEGINRRAVVKMMEHFDAADQDALLAFMQQPVFKRLLAFNQTLVALEAQIAAEPDPDLDAKIEAIVDSALARFPPAPPISWRTDSVANVPPLVCRRQHPQ